MAATIMGGGGIFLHKLWRSKVARWGGGVLFIVLILQLVFPYDRAFLGAHIGNKSISFQHRDEISDGLLADFSAASVTIKGSNMQDSLKNTGVGVDAKTSAEQMTTYPLLQRFIPFSFLGQFSKAGMLSLTFDEQKNSAWTNEILKKCTVAPVEASAKLQGAIFVATPEKSGQSCDGDVLKKSVKQIQFLQNSIVEANSKEVFPTVHEKEVAPKITAMNAAIQKGIIVRAAGKSVAANAEEVASWIDVKNEKGAFSFVVDPTRLEEFGQRVAAVATLPAVDTIVTKQNGTEISRTPGRAGQGVDVEALKKSIAQKVTAAEAGEITAASVKIEPKVSEINLYSGDSAGLAMLLKYITDSSSDMAITVQSISGKEFSASSRGSKQYSPASTYKLGVAYVVLKYLQSGEWKPNDAIAGSNVETCLQKMIRVSDNACAEAFGEKITWKKIQEEVRAIGMSNTIYWSSNGFLSTTDDQVTFLKKLQQGALLDSARTTQLLDLMKSQVYRQGIPAGIPGLVVANKVGFLGGLLHDSALVYTAHGTYALSVYSKNSTWADIAAVARQVEANIAQ